MDEPRAYGWHNPHFPPEYRRACLRGGPYEVDIYTEVYFMMACWYEAISGKKAPGDFSLCPDWKNNIRHADICKEISIEETEQIIRAIETGTRRNKQERDPGMIQRILSLVTVHPWKTE